MILSDANVISLYSDTIWLFVCIHVQLTKSRCLHTHG